MGQSHGTVTHGSAVRVTTNLGLEVHLDGEQSEKRGHHDDPGHGWILFSQERWQTWVSQGSECRRNKL
jgi:hypothetical protein